MLNSKETNPFKYLDVTLTLSLDWSYQQKSMTDNPYSYTQRLELIICVPIPNQTYQ